MNNLVFWAVRAFSQKNNLWDSSLNEVFIIKKKMFHMV